MCKQSKFIYPEKEFSSPRASVEFCPLVIVSLLFLVTVTFGVVINLA